MCVSDWHWLHPDSHIDEHACNLCTRFAHCTSYTPRVFVLITLPLAFRCTPHILWEPQPGGFSFCPRISSETNPGMFASSPLWLGVLMIPWPSWSHYNIIILYILDFLCHPDTSSLLHASCMPSSAWLILSHFYIIIFIRGCVVFTQLDPCLWILRLTLLELLLTYIF